MKRRKKGLSAGEIAETAGRVIKGIILTGFCIQIVLGIVWMCCNAASVQDFAPPSRGIYRALAGLLDKRLYPLVYGLQLLVALGAGRALCRQAWRTDGWKPVFGALALLTLPMAMQCHMALLPYSPVCSLGLAQLCLLGKLSAPEEKGSRERTLLLLAGSGCYLLQILLLPEALLLGAVPLAFLYWRRVRPDRKGGQAPAGQIGRQLALLGVTVVLAAGAWSLAAAGEPERRFAEAGLSEDGSGEARAEVGLTESGAEEVRAEAGLTESGPGETQAETRQAEAGQLEDGLTKTRVYGVWWLLTKRVCWPTLWVDSDGLPDRIWEAAGDVLWESTYYPENMDSIFRPALEQTLEQEEVKGLLQEMTANAWRVHYPMVIRQVGWDVLGYVITPVILPLQLSGDAYEAHSGRNYEIMRNAAPTLTRYYVSYSCWWFGTALVLTVLCAGLRLAAGKRLYGRQDRIPGAAVILGAAAAVCWYTLQGAGIMDYKYTIFINEMWLLWSLTEAGGRSLDEKEGGLG